MRKLCKGKKRMWCLTHSTNSTQSMTHREMSLRKVSGRCQEGRKDRKRDGWLGSPPWRGSQELLGVLLCVVTYRLHAHDGLFHLGDVCDVVLIGFELLLLDPFIDAYHQLSGDVSTIIHTYQCGGVRASDKKDTIALHTGAPGRWP